MFGRHETDVVVVGAGPVGLFAALTLVERGLRVQVVDEAWRSTLHTYALALHPRSLQLLERVGVARDALARCVRVDRVIFSDESGPRATIRYSDLNLEHPFVAVLRQDVLEALLEEHLRARGVKVQWNHRVRQLRPDENHVEVNIDELEKESCGYAVASSEWQVRRSTTTRAAFVLGADGHRSTVRRLLDINYPLVGTPAMFAVFEFEIDRDLPGELHVLLHQNSSNVLWPLPGKSGRWSFQVQESEPDIDAREKNRLLVQVGSQAFPSLAREELLDLIRVRAPWFRERIGDVRWSILIRFEQRLAERFGAGRCWLAGDAGHMAGPIGVQSMNVGLREADELVSIIDRVQRGSATLDAFNQYGQERQREWRRLLEPDARGPNAQPWIQQNQARIVSAIPASGEELSRLLGQLGLEENQDRT